MRREETGQQRDETGEQKDERGDRRAGPRSSLLLLVSQSSTRPHADEPKM